MFDFSGKYVLVRCQNKTIYAGIVAYYSHPILCLANASELIDCKALLVEIAGGWDETPDITISDPVAELMLTDVSEIIPCTDEVRTALEPRP